MKGETKSEVIASRGIWAGIVHVFDKLIDWFGHGAELIMVFILALIAIEVVVRFFMGNSIIWAIEVTEYCLLWMTFLAAAWVLKKEGHVMVDLVPNALTPRARTALLFTLSILGTVICLVYAYFGTWVTIDQFQKERLLSTIIRPPAWILFIIIPAGNILLTVQFIRRTTGLGKKMIEAWKA
jgi:C4-dicarboxylate transporter, DctQ subunit